MTDKEKLTEIESIVREAFSDKWAIVHPHVRDLHRLQALANIYSRFEHGFEKFAQSAPVPDNMPEQITFDDLSGMV